MDFNEIKSAYSDYAARLTSFRDKIKSDRKWFSQTQTELQGKEEKEKGKDVPNFHSGHIFNAVQYKHADAMDNYPCANVLPREAGDEEGAKLLTQILPFVFEKCKFKKTYSLNLYNKIASGTCAYGVFWDDDICIKDVDLLNFLWQPDAKSLQDSRYVFYDSFMPKADFITMHGDVEGCAMQSSHFEVDEKAGQEAFDTVVITDCYYKVREKDGRILLHFVKYSGNKILFSSEDGEYPDGFYKHGRYPFCFDVLNPVPGQLTGLGIVDISKNMQARIDKLDASITRHAVRCAKSKVLYNKSIGVSKDEFVNDDAEFIEAMGDLSNGIRDIEVAPLPAFVTNHRDKLIDELKEICGNRDFAQGGTSGGVTSGSAITLLQTANDKLTRDSVSFSYLCFAEISELAIELIREFYTEEKVFRITGDDGRSVYKRVKHDDIFGASDSAVFDVLVTVEKSNPYSRAMHNSLIMELAGAGLLNPENFAINKFILMQLNFDGKDKLIADLEVLHNELNKKSVPGAGGSGADIGAGGMPGGGGDALVEIPVGDSGAMGNMAEPLVEIPVE